MPRSGGLHVGGAWYAEANEVLPAVTHVEGSTDLQNGFYGSGRPFGFFYYAGAHDDVIGFLF